MQQNAMPMTKEEFYKVYWFNPLQMVTLVNPKAYDYKFMVEMRNFIIKAGAKEKMPGTVANVYLSQMTRIMAQDEDKTSFLSDFALMKQYYDKLIVDVESLIAEDRSQPAYLQNVPATMKAEGAPETPPWQAPAPSSIPETNSQMSNTWTPKPADQADVKTTNATVTDAPADKQVKESTKEFEYEGAKYKMTIDKNDKEMFFRDGTRIDAPTYAKAASML